MSKENSVAANEVRRLLRQARGGSLATLDRDTGHPYASLVNVATDLSGRPILFISRLAWHTRNLEKNPKASLLVSEPAASGRSGGGKNHGDRRICPKRR